MIFRLETELLLTPDGRVNELFGTEPDVKLPSTDLPRSITREDLLRDACIRKVLTEL
jgi:C-terminal processing protease CtpA/Prc